MANTASLVELSHESIWFDQHKYEEAELEYQQYLAQHNHCGAIKSGPSCHESKSAASASHKSSLVNEIAKAREHIQKSLNSDVPITRSDTSLAARITTLEEENKHLRKISHDLESVIKRLDERISTLELGKPSPAATAKPAVCPAKPTVFSAKPASASADDDDVDDEDFELFKDDEEDDAEAERVKQERVKAYEDKKAKKPVLIAKSNIILDIKPWDDETDMAELEKSVRSIEMDGLLWGSSKLVPLAYTIKKLQISCVVEDDKVSTDDLEERIMAFEDLVQSVDIAAFNKI